MSKNKGAGSTKSELSFVINDLHFPKVHTPTWNAFVKCVRDLKPKRIIGNGDLCEFNMLSPYPQEQNADIHAVDHIISLVKHINPLAKLVDEVILINGNHDNRWDRIVAGSVDPRLKGAKGLKFSDQCYQQGLNKDIRMIKEDMLNKGVKLGPILVRHGDKQCKGFGGGGKHVAATRMANSMGRSEIFGHFHRAQMFCFTSHDRGTVFSIANPCMTDDHDYNLDPNWQRGFTIIETYGPNKKFATPHLIVVQDGHFAFNGKVYDGNI